MKETIRVPVLTDSWLNVGGLEDVSHRRGPIELAEITVLSGGVERSERSGQVHIELRSGNWSTLVTLSESILATRKEDPVMLAWQVAGDPTPEITKKLLRDLRQTIEKQNLYVTALESDLVKLNHAYNALLSEVRVYRDERF